MKTAMMKHVAAAALVSTLTAASAFAQEAPAPAPQGGVSTMNGQLVPVGNHNEYEYAFKRWNVSTNPLGLVVGSYGLSISYGLNQNVALRGDVNYYDPVGDDDTGSGFELGVGAPIYLRKTYKGPFVEPGVIVRSITSEDVDGKQIDSTAVGPQVLLGWQWMWDSGLNIAVALGMGRNFSTEDSPGTDADDAEIFGNGYLRIGYAF